jgi:hypothetical protein
MPRTFRWRFPPILHARRRGLEGWSYEDVLPCYKKMETDDHGDLPVGRHYMDQPASLVLHATKQGKLGANEPAVSVILAARSGGRQDGPPDLHVVPTLITGVVGPSEKGRAISINVAVPRPEDDSRGRLTLASRDPAYLLRSNSGSCATRRISRSSTTASNWRAGSLQPSPSRTISTRRSRRDPRSGADRRSSHSSESMFRPTFT